MPRKIVFISLPMSGYTDDEVRGQLKAAEDEYLRRFSFSRNDVLFMDNCDPAPDLPSYTEENRTRVYYLGRALKRIAQCDEVFFFGNWLRSSRCRIERDICIAYSIPCSDQ